MMRFVNTREAARETGLSEYTLRQGFKQGRFPALEVGRGSRRRWLRWGLDVLESWLEERILSERDGRCWGSAV
ncbi:MAG: hypothetical protein Q4G52_03235, partial [Clostridia bacterium]|nr:hypothetical protein [Clostridia bacterium]